jgi:hypothetical protein
MSFDCALARNRVEGDRCSSQNLVSRCHYYEQFTTEEALQAAAEIYGVLTNSML